MPEEVKHYRQWLTRKWFFCSQIQVALWCLRSIRGYLSATNVQLGATYAVGKKSTALYNAGYEAGAKYINASTNEIGKYQFFL